MFLCVGRLVALNVSPFGLIKRVGVQATSWGISLAVTAVVLYANWLSDPLYRHVGALEVYPDVPALSIFRTRPDRLRAARYILARTRPDERIHSATGRHDKIFANDVLIYFLSARMPASRWHKYEPGAQNTLRIQHEIIRDLETQSVSMLVRSLVWDRMQEPNRSADSSGVEVLDQYLDRNYLKDKQFGDIILYQRIR